VSAVLLTLAEAETAVWNRINDNDTTHALSQSVLDALLNRAYCIVKGLRDDRPRELTATQTGLTLADGTKVYTIGNTVPIRHILSAYHALSVGSTVPNDAPLQRWSRSEVQRMQFEDSVKGGPVAAAFWRLGTATAADVGKWGATFWRVPDATYYIALSAICDPTPLSNSTDVFDVTPDLSQAIVDMTASLGARLIGRHDLAAALREDVPQVFASALGQMESDFFGKVVSPAEQQA